MFGSRRQQQEELRAAQKAAADHRRNTEEGVRNALDSRWPDWEFAVGWKKQEEVHQRILDAKVRDLRPKKRWWQS